MLEEQGHGCRRESPADEREQRLYAGPYHSHEYFFHFRPFINPAILMQCPQSLRELDKTPLWSACYVRVGIGRGKGIPCKIS